MQVRASDRLIEDIILATYGKTVAQRQRYLLSQVLRSLVRLARSEQRADMRRDVQRAAGALASSSSRREARAILRKVSRDASEVQRQLEFGQRDSAAPEPDPVPDEQPCPGPEAPDLGRVPRR